MKNTHARISELESILSEEIEYLGLLHACQKRIYESVIKRDWVMLQNETALSDTISESYLEAESKRIIIARSIRPSAEGTKDFYSITALLPAESRTRINELFREVKHLLLLSKTENDSLYAYVSNARTVVSGVIETMLPARRNKIYNRRGSLAPTQVESVVLNRSF